jgi:ATP-dependent exoDNAse (exonuclease V) beta subunit
MEGESAVSRFKVFVAGSIVAALVLGTSVAFAEPLSEQQWRKQANSVCKQLDKDLDEIADEFYADLDENEEPTPKQFAALAKQASPLFEEGLASIDALNEPKALKKDFKKFEAAVSEAVAAIQADPSAFTDGGENPFARSDKIAQRLGLRACTGA